MAFSKEDQNYVVELVTLECVECARCGVPFGVSQQMLNRRREDGKVFLCPSGHENVYGNSEVKRLREQLQREQIAKQEVERKAANALMEVATHKKNTEKAVKSRERLLKRTEEGMCPHCQRTFKQLAEHMKCKHSVPKQYPKKTAKKATKKSVKKSK